MSNCDRCGPYSGGHGKHSLYKAYDAAFEIKIQDDSPHGHPSPMREQWVDCWQDIRIGVDGVKAVRDNAFDRGWIEPPESIDYLLEYGDINEKKTGKRNLKFYINRAQYPEIVRFARDITIGRILRKEPEYKGISVDEADTTLALSDTQLDSFDDTGLTFEQLTRHMLGEKFTVGRSALYIYNTSAAGAVEAKAKFYAAENIWTWTKAGELELVVFRETETVADGKYAHKQNIIYRELCLEDGRVIERIWRQNDNEEYVVSDEQALLIREANLTRIPVVFDGGRTPTNPPYQALFSKSIEAFQISAQLKHRLFKVHSSWLHVDSKSESGGGIIDPFEAQEGEMEKPQGEPMPLVPGHGVLQTNNSTAQYLIDEGAGITHLRDEREACLKEMASLGARFGVNFGAGNVSTDTERMQQGGETAFIISHISDTSEAITQALRWKAELEGKDEAKVREISVTLNKQLTDEGLPYTLEEVCKAYDAGLISGEIAFEHVKQILPSIPAEATWAEVYANIIAEQSGVFELSDDPLGAAQGDLALSALQSGGADIKALNGAQVTSLLEIIDNAAQGNLPRESAVALIQASFPSITREVVLSILDPLKGKSLSLGGPSNGGANQ